jgi:hypothetical protein
MKLNSIVVAYLKEPREKIWGVLIHLDQVGLTIRGIELNSFEDWCSQIAQGGEQLMGLSVIFIPTARIEKILLDETTGSVPSLKDKFQSIVGLKLEDYLGL